MGNLFKSILFCVVFCFIYVSATILYAASPIQETNWSGVECHLLGLNQVGNVVTLKFALKNKSNEDTDVEIDIDKVALVDESNQKKYFGLKDSDGNYIGTEFYSIYKNKWQKDIESNTRQLFWLKFPAPTNNPQSVTVIIPGVLPFEGVSITK